MLIISDLDGTVVNLMEAFCLKMLNEYGVLLTPEDFVKHDISEEVLKAFARRIKEVEDDAIEAWARQALAGKDRPEGVKRFLRGCWEDPSLYSHRAARPYLNVLRGLLFNQRIGTRIHFITRRKKVPGMLDTTVDWLRCYGLVPNVELISSSPSAKARKVAAYNKNGEPTIILEDNPQEVRWYQEFLPRDVSTVVLVPKRPWNSSMSKSELTECGACFVEPSPGGVFGSFSGG